MPRTITFSKAVNEALHQVMTADPSVVCFGLGTDDPKGIFGTTLNLKESFGSQRVFDMPTAENAMTGVAIGMAINGMKAVMSHQRLDFFLLALDQLVNNAAKWRYMFGGKHSANITIRLIIGRGWGQGPTHSQSLQSWFAHIPGLKVVMPSSPYDAKGLLIESILDPNPVLFLEHRWLHEAKGEVPEAMYRLPLNKSRLVQEGKDITIVSLSYMTAEAIRAIEVLKKANISAELIDLCSINPIDWTLILESVKKTGRLLVLDTSNVTCSVSSEIIAKTTTEVFSSLKTAPARIAPPDTPSPTTAALTKYFYPDASHVARAVSEMLKKEIDLSCLVSTDGTLPHDIPGPWFKGPF